MKKIVTYLLLTFILSGGAYYVEFNAAALGVSPLLAVFFLMWCPGIAAIATSLIYDRNLGGLGLRPGALRWWGAAYLVPIGYATIAYAVIWLAGFGRIDLAHRIHPVTLVIFGTVFNVAFAAGEEIGWRGFLAPQLYRRMSFAASCLVTGAIWSAWHFPSVIAGAYLAKMPTAAQLALLVASITAMTFAANWFRLRSGSVWPAIMLHASHNLYIQWLFDPITKETGPLSKYMLGESGIALTVVLACLAVVFWRLGPGTGCRKERRGNEASPA